MTEAQRGFVEEIAEYYFRNDGMPHERGRVIGWLIISEPHEQSASAICDRLGVARSDVDWVSRQLVPAKVLSRRDAGSGEYHLTMGDSAWVDRMEEVFGKIPAFHEILQEGATLLAGAPEGRARRVVNMERFFGYLATEIPQVFDRYRETVQPTSA
jgi:hypothetical protein